MHMRSIFLVLSALFMTSGCVDALQYNGKDDVCPQKSAQTAIHGQCI